MTGWQLTDDSNKLVVKSFRGATTSQMKWHVKSTTEQNPKNIILHCGTNDINNDSDLQNIAEEIVKLAKSISIDCTSNVTVSGIVPRYGNLSIVFYKFTAEIWTCVLLGMKILTLVNS